MNKNFDGIISINELAALRLFAGLNCATEQGIRLQIKQGRSGAKTWQELGFELTDGPGQMTWIKILTPALEDFRLKINKFAKDNAPKG
jgi:hypothetical protein